MDSSNFSEEMVTMLLMLRDSNVLYKKASVEGIYNNFNYKAVFNRSYQIRCYMWRSILDNKLYVCFLGTKTLRDAVYDFKFGKTSSDYFVGKVHKGFWLLFTEFYDHLKKEVANYIRLYRITEINVLGHSMGAVLGLFFSLFFRDVLVGRIWLFCLPRFSDTNFNQWSSDQLKTQNTSLIILQNSFDVVTRVPPRFLGYATLESSCVYYSKWHCVPHKISNMLQDAVEIKCSASSHLL